jgi:hypothetical protein
MLSWILRTQTNCAGTRKQSLSPDEGRVRLSQTGCAAIVTWAYLNRCWQALQVVDFKVQTIVEGMTFFRFSSGRIVEAWSIVDIATLRKQLS